MDMNLSTNSILESNHELRFKSEYEVRIGFGLRGVPGGGTRSGAKFKNDFQMWGTFCEFCFLKDLKMSSGGNYSQQEQIFLNQTRKYLAHLSSA